MGNTLAAPAPIEPPVPQYIPQPDDPLLKRQSVLAEGTGTWGSGVHRSALAVDGKMVGSEDPFVTTAYDMFRLGATKYPDSPCLGWRPMENGVAGDYTFISYREVSEWVTDIGSAIRHVGHKRGDNVGIYSRNRPEWTVTGLACSAYAHASVAIYDTFGPDSARYIISHSEQTICFFEASKLESLYVAVEAGTPSLRHAVCFGTCKQEDVDRFAAKGVTLLNMDDFRKMGQEHRIPHDPPKPEDTQIIMYTSGTTGSPKGVVQTHFAILANANGSGHILKFNHGDVHFSYLPLAHMYECMAQQMIMKMGGRIGFYQGDIRKMADDIRALRPTIFAAVPRVCNTFYEKIMKAVDSGGFVTKQLYSRAYAYRLAALTKGQDTPWYNYLIFDKLKDVLGGRVRLLMTGSAPLDSRIHEWMRVCICPVIMQGYGMTETCGGATIQCENDTAVGTVGMVVPCCEFKLIDVPDMEYMTSDSPPRGEVLVRGNTVLSHYHKDPEKTKEDKDDEGWMHTGDIGRWNDNGSLSIIDRKKNIFKLAQGEYVAVEQLENVYSNCDHVAQIHVYGDSLKSFLLAVVVPDQEKTMNWAKAKGIEGNFAAVCKHPDLKKLLDEEMKEQAKRSKLMGFELVKGIIVHDQPYTIENNMLTPTFKIKRPVAVKAFKAEFDKLYKEIEATTKK